MSFTTFNEKIEKHILSLANRLSSQRRLEVIRDASISLIPITLMDGVATVIGAVPVIEETTNGFLLAWASLTQDNATLLPWINALTLGGMTVYVYVGTTYFLMKYFKRDVSMPIILSVCGFLILILTPQ